VKRPRVASEAGTRSEQPAGGLGVLRSPRAARLLFLALLPGPERRVYAGREASQSPADEQDYASPLEFCFRPTARGSTCSATE
jgi:hypothetical protein